MNDERIVRFDLYCDTCEYRDNDETKDICNECLGNPVNIDSRKPINYKKKED